MERIKLTKNLYLDEYIHEGMYLELQKKGKLHRAKYAIDKRVVLFDQFLREKFGAVTINNWWNGGARTWSGLRTPDSPYYSPLSQHTFGRASDKKFGKYDAAEVIEWIRKNSETLHNVYSLGGLEVRASWVHTDVRNTDKVVIFAP